MIIELIIGMVAFAAICILGISLADLGERFEKTKTGIKRYQKTVEEINKIKVLVGTSGLDSRYLDKANEIKESANEALSSLSTTNSSIVIKDALLSIEKHVQSSISLYKEVQSEVFKDFEKTNTNTVYSIKASL